MKPDRLVKWARPALIWSGLVMSALTDVLIPLVSYYTTGKELKLSLDPNFWDAWSLCVAIYVGGRTVEKIDLAKLARGPKASQGGKSVEGS